MSASDSGFGREIDKHIGRSRTAKEHAYICIYIHTYIKRERERERKRRRETVTERDKKSYIHNCIVTYRE